MGDVGTSETLIDTLSYGSKWVDNVTMLGLLARFRVIIERIKDHGIVTGNWDRQLNWINTQIGKVKELMGPFPSFDSALVSIGFKYGHLFEHDIRSKGICGIKDDPWYYFEQYLNTDLSLGETPYSADIPTFKITWKSFSDKTKELLRMLSRMELTAQQIKLWQDEASRLSAGYKIRDEELISNPYVMAEDDEGDKEHYPVSIEAVDLALFKDKAIQGECIPEQPYLVESEIDPRRIRAIIISILKQASNNGDTLLSIEDINQRFVTVKLQRPVEVPPQYIIAHIEFMKEKMIYFHDTTIPALQLKKYSDIETYLSKIFIARAKKEIDYISEDWDTYIKQTVDAFKDNNERHKAALKDQKNALNRLTSRKLTVLHGAAGTGKTTVMGALFKSATLREEGVLLLAPTGKARVRLSNMAQSSAFTIAQFLNKQGRFDWSRMKVKFDGKSKYKAEQNIIIDECSMLTVEDFYALFNALDLAHVKRIILVGDPFQLPPIGAGRPFADLCNYLESSTDQSDTSPKLALAKLEEVVRTRTTGESDTLTLASWFTGSKPKKNADEIFSRIGNKEKLNDLEFRCWKTPDDLERLVLDALVDVLELDDDKDYVKFNNSLGIESIKANPEKVESHQILTPVRNPVWGSFALNRLIQAHFRRTWATLKVGEQKMKQNDKVIQLTNEKRKSYPSNEEEQLSNGQIGIIERINGKYANVIFSGLPQKTFGYQSSGAEDDSAPIELAYAITVHKSQGSDFSKVFLIIPKSGKIMSRELIYTALTRAKDQLVILIEGDSPHSIIELSKPQYSNTAVRNTQLFSYSVRETTSSIPFVEGLIHKTLKDGLIVRSKSEVIIANMLYERNIEFEYEREFKGKNGQRRIPDFTFIDAAGEIVILEHLGMLSKPAYRLEWEKKLKFYNENGFNLDENLFITSDDESGAINSLEIEKLIKMIMAVV